MSRWAKWSRGQQEKPRFVSDFVKEALDTGNPAVGSSPAERARQMGLQSDGSGGYIDPETGQTVARTVNGELVFYDNRGMSGGVVSDGAGGQALANAQPSWTDPMTGLAITPPSRPESPEEQGAVPDPIPAAAPAGYNSFINNMKQQAYQMGSMQRNATADINNPMQAAPTQGINPIGPDGKVYSGPEYPMGMPGAPGTGVSEAIGDNSEMRDRMGEGPKKGKTFPQMRQSLQQRMAAAYDNLNSQETSATLPSSKPSTDSTRRARATVSNVSQQPNDGVKRSRFAMSGSEIGGSAPTEMFESASLGAVSRMMRGNAINDDNLQDAITQAQQFYNLSPKEAKELIGSARGQADLLGQWLDKRGISPEDRMKYRFARIDGTDNDIDEELLPSRDILNNLHDRLKGFLGGSEGLREMFDSTDNNAYNPTDIYGIRGDIEDELQEKFDEILKSGDQSPEGRRNAVNAVFHLMREYAQDGRILPMSLKHTAGAKAKLAEQNYHELSEDGLQTLATSILDDVAMNIGLTDTKGRGRGPVDFGNNELSLNLAMRGMLPYADGEESTPMDMFAKYYLLGQATKGDRWLQMKNESKPLVKKKRGEGFTSASEKFGSIPVNMLQEHLREMRNIPDDADEDYMMGMEDTLYPGQEEVEAMYPVGKNGKRTAANQRKYEEAMKNAGTKSGSRFRDLNEDEVKYYGDMLEQIAQTNEANKFVPPRANNLKSGVNVDLSSVSIGDRSYGPGEYGEYMQGVADVERAIRMAKNPETADEAQKILDGYFGEGTNMSDNDKKRFAARTRNQMTRISVARRLQELYEQGNLSKTMMQAIMKGQKVSFDNNRPLMPFLKLGADSNLDPKTYGLSKEEVMWILDMGRLL